MSIRTIDMFWIRVRVVVDSLTSIQRDEVLMPNLIAFSSSFAQAFGEFFDDVDIESMNHDYFQM